MVVRLLAIMRGFKCHLGPYFSGCWPGGRYRQVIYIVNTIRTKKSDHYRQVTAKAGLTALVGFTEELLFD